MNPEEFHAFCAAKPGVEASFPFNETTLVFKVMGKMFALGPLDANPFRINLKCDPERAVELREEYPTILPGYHMNKQHWITLVLDGSLPNALVIDLINHSYELIVSSLPKKKKEELDLLGSE